MKKDTMRILAQGRLISNNTWTTHINNNDLIIGPSGAGKTRNYVKPNLLQYALEGGCSLIIADTKGSLVEEVGPVMAVHGYKIINLDFIDLINNAVGYNPLDYISYDPRQGGYSEAEISTIVSALVPIETRNDPFWEQSAQIFLSSFIGYVLETLPPEEHTLESVTVLYQNLDQPALDEDGYVRQDSSRKPMTVGSVLFEELKKQKPFCGACRNYQMASTVAPSEKTYASIQMFLTKNLAPLTLDGARRLYSLEDRIDFRSLGREKTAVFLTISDTDRSMDKLVNLFYTQALNQLIKIADSSPGHRLPIPVRFILDDFAANVVIPDFDNIISVIRSREISVSLIIQSITQLNSLYDVNSAKTIINNCDSCLYLGGQDVDTAQFIGVKSDRTEQTVLNMPLDDVWLFVRGTSPSQVQKYDLTTHPLYKELPEAGGTPPALPKAEDGRVGPGMDCPVLRKYIMWARNGELDQNLEQYLQIQKQLQALHIQPPSKEKENEEERPILPVAAEIQEGPPAGLEEGPEDPWGPLPPANMTHHQVSRLRERRNELPRKVSQLQTLLSGRTAQVLPLAADRQGQYSEDAARTLAGRLGQAVNFYDCHTLHQDLNIKTSSMPLYPTFFYCAVRLCANRPPWMKELHGTFDDIQNMARQAAVQSKSDLYFNELYHPEYNSMFFRCMDEMYELLAGHSIKNTLSEAALTAARDQRALERMREMEQYEEEYMDDDENPSRGFTGQQEADQNLGIDFSLNWSEEDLEWLREDAIKKREEEKVQLEQAKKDWVEAFACKEMFCQQYLKLRWLLFQNDNQAAMETAVSSALDVVLAEENISKVLDKDVFSQTCTLVDNAIAYLQEQTSPMRKAKG